VAGHVVVWKGEQFQCLRCLAVADTRDELTGAHDDPQALESAIKEVLGDLAGPLLPEAQPCGR